MNSHLFFVLEHNLKPLQMILRGFRHSAFLTYDKEIGLFSHSEDMDIINQIAQQKKDLGIDRIILTRDTRTFVNFIGNNEVKVIILQDKTKIWKLYDMRLKQLAQEIIMRATKMTKRTSGQDISYIECSHFYKK